MKKAGFLAALAAGLIAFRFEQSKWLVRYAVRERPRPMHGMSALPPCPKCNLLLVSLDTFRADRVGTRTPNLAAIAGESLSFSHAYANGFFTTPSHMTLFTSLYPNTHHVESQRIPLRGQPGKKSSSTVVVLDEKYPTLAETLSRNGYRTEWHGPLRSKFLSLREGFGRGFEKTTESPFGRGVDFGTYKLRSFDSNSLRTLSGGSPAFLFLHTYLPHIPYFHQSGPALYTGALLEDFAHGIAQSPALLVEQNDSSPDRGEVLRKCTRTADIQPCLRYFSADPFWHGVGSWQLLRLTKNFEQDPHEAENAARAYDGNIAEMDRQVGQMWNELKRSAVLENTLVIFFSDHGQELFEHGSLFHNSFYEHTARVPLIIYHPKVKAGAVTARLTSLIDVMPAILEILQIESPKTLQGHVPWKHENQFVFGYSLGTDFVSDGEWKLIKGPSGREELYHLQLDPSEHQNLIGFANPWTFSAYKRLSSARRDWELSQSL